MRNTESKLGGRDVRHVGIYVGWNKRVSISQGPGKSDGMNSIVFTDEHDHINRIIWCGVVHTLVLFWCVI